MCFWRLCHKRHDRWVLDLVVELTGRVPKSHTTPDDVTCILADSVDGSSGRVSATHMRGLDSVPCSRLWLFVATVDN